MSKPTDFERSRERLLDAEDHRSEATGFGTTKQGQALAREYREQLAERIAADLGRGVVSGDRAAWADVPKLRKPLMSKSRAHVRDKAVVRALKDIDAETISLRLLIAGVSVSENGNLGVDDDGEKNFREQARWIGGNLIGTQHHRKLNFKVGAWGIDKLISLPVFGLDTGDILKMTAAADVLMDDVLNRAVASNPLLSPLTTPPVPWTQVRKGGLPADHWAKVPFIRVRHRSIEAAAKNAIGARRMQPVLDAVNVLQRVAFTINKPVLDFIHRWGKPPDPEIPPPPIWQQEKRQEWNEARASASVFHMDMVTADAMADVEHFWVPLNIDFRGRLYGVANFNFAREDRVRAMFLFADGEPIGEDGLKWLKAHVAGTAGGKPRKLGHYGRVKWTDDNLEKLCEVGRAVLRRDDPATIDWDLPKDRYQFLAACVELTQAIDTGPDFITRLPLMFDGSCSALQHLTAMTRAEEGKFVNLTAAFEPDDFYGRVAESVWEANPDLRHLMHGKDDRDIVKQPSMSYFYGSRPGGFAKSKDGRWHSYGMTKQIIDVLKERRKNSTDGAQALADAIHKAIGGMVPLAKDVRDFLEELARLYAKKGKPLRWTTPAGLPVINAYHEAEIKRIPVSLKGRTRTVKLVIGDKVELKKQKAANSAAANFVHSVDATHLQAVAIEAAKSGIEIVCVHDCFGCIAPRAWRLKEAIHVKFVQLHKRNLLAEVLASAQVALPKNTKLPRLPETGTLKLEGMYSNYHAFKN
jgi:DNA-directed RNA polymerase